MASSVPVVLERGDGLRSRSRQRAVLLQHDAEVLGLGAGGLADLADDLAVFEPGQS